MFSSRINKLKDKIETYIKLGGDIYDGRRDLPYYKYMSLLKRDMEEQYNITLTMEYMYSLCGIRFDREFNHYKEACKKLKEYADENGCVDSLRKIENKKEGSVYFELKEMARKQGASFMDYIYFMTPYRLTTGRIQGDSIAKLKRDLLKAYPTRDLSGIRWDNVSLYERIRSLQLVMPEKLSRQEFIEFLGFSNDRFSNKPKIVNVDEKEVIDELIKLYPDKQISNITIKAKQLYPKVVRLAFSEDLTVQQWLKTKGFIYSTGIASSRLSSTQVSFDTRTEELAPIRKKYEKKILKPNMNEVDKYYAKLEVMKKSLAELEENEKEFSKSHGLSWD